MIKHECVGLDLSTDITDMKLDNLIFYYFD